MLQKMRRGILRPFNDAGTASLLAILCAALYLPKLATLYPTSSNESIEGLEANNLSTVVESPLFAPFRLALLAIYKFDLDSVLTPRILPVLAVALAVIVLYHVLRQWHTTRVAFLSTVLFATASFSLHSARFVASEVMYMLVVPAFLLLGTWLASKRHDKKIPFALALLAGVLYVPGVWAFMVAGLIAYKSQVRKIWTQLSGKLKAISVLTFLVPLIPLFYSFRYASNAVEWAGLNYDNGFNAQEILSNATAFFDALIFRGLDDSSKWLSGTPILDAFTLAMLVLGVYAYRRGLHPTREKSLIIMAVISFLLVVIGGSNAIGIIMPLIYVFAANGIAYMLQSWFTVFPRNPLVRYIGVALLVLCVTLAAFFQIKRYFIAWPNDPDTRASQAQIL